MEIVAIIDGDTPTRLSAKKMAFLIVHLYVLRIFTPILLQVPLISFRTNYS